MARLYRWGDRFELDDRAISEMSALIITKTAVLRHGTLLMTSVCWAASSMADTPKSSIIFIFADDLGYGNVSCYNLESKAPNLDRLAKDGMKITDAPGQLYNFAEDPGKTTKLYFDKPIMVKKLKGLLEKAKSSGRSAPVRG